MRFLTEKQVAGAVKDLIEGQTDVRVAVAFWGRGGGDLLGINRGQSKARVLCNLDSGACNPDELLDLKRQTILRTHAQLHAKIYWTPEAVIVGSSNASTNGLWGEGKDARGWREANVLTEDEGIITEIGEWFEAQWRESASVTLPMIKAAHALWDSGRDRAPPGRPLQKTLIGAFLSAPQHPIWKRVKLAAYVDGLSPEAENEYETEIRENSALTSAAAYEEWHGHFVANDLVIDVDGTGQKPVVTLLKVGDELIESERLTYLLRTTSFDIPGLGRFKLTPQEKAAFSTLGTRLMQRPKHKREGGVSLPFAKAIQELRNTDMLP
ncbi:MAG: phospholipase D family protein [Proteobacteria bacterium]|nr:phospholipase D family protein [Pseudomonadota bacterium]MDA1320667.1 phospholipase D family protein [Pseudomonadota bacterium]